MNRTIACLLLIPVFVLLPTSIVRAGDEEPARLGFGDWALEDDGRTGWLEVTWDWPDGRLAGFQFELSALSITGIRGGLAEEYDFTLASSATTAIGFFSTPQGYIPPTDGEQVLVIVDFELANDDDMIRLEEVVCADTNAQAIDVIHDETINPYEQPCCGDINGDGLVDGVDLTILLGEWGEQGASDLDGDGLIDGADVTILLGCWGPCP